MSYERFRPSRTAMAVFGVSAIAALPATVLARSPEKVTTDTATLADGVTTNRYYVTFLTQTYDGTTSRSLMQRGGFARVRNGDESWVRIVLGDGALVTLRDRDLRAARFDGTGAAQTAVLYNFKTQTMSGNPGLSDYHNRFIRPLLDRAPALGEEARWTVNVTPIQLGFQGVDDGAMTIAIRRHYFTFGRRRLVLLDYTLPEAGYTRTGGERYLHAGRGVALADPGFGQVYWSASLHTAHSTRPGARPRPFRYARTSFAMDGRGRPLLDIRKIPELKPVIAELYGVAATTQLPIVGMDEKPDQLPLQIAAVVDAAAFAIAENSANQLAETIATGAFGGGSTGQSAGATIDTVINDVVIPAASAIGGEAKLASLEANAAKLKEGNAAIQSLKTSRAALASQSATVLADLKAAAIVRADILKQIATEARKTTDSAQFIKNTAYRRAALSELNGEIKALLSQAKNLAIAQISKDAEIANVVKELPAVEKVWDLTKGMTSTSTAFKEFSSLVNGLKGFSTSMTYLSYAANTAGIAKNIYLIKNFDPYKGGDLQLNGTYDGYLSVVEYFANLASIGGDAASGNLWAVGLDIGNFVGGRVSDIYMSYTAMNAANQQAAYAEMQAALKLTELNGRRMNVDIKSALADADRIGNEISALKGQMSSGRSTTAPDWQDPRIDAATGLPKPAYWQWLKDNDPDKLRAMGIDPDAPVGGWPAATTQTDTEMPQQPGGPNYPTRDPRTIKKRPKTSKQPTPFPDDPGSPPQDTTPAQPVAHYPAATVRASNNPGASAWEWQATTFTLGNFDLGTFKNDDWVPVTFDPVTWTPPTWTPVTWTPPKWTPVTFDAPKPSDLPFTTINDGQQYPATAGNMAYSFASIDGKVATDLSPYAGWLKTQNQQYVEQLAKTAGYPNLASALADSASLIAHAQDAGFKQWAWSAPVADPFVSADIDQSQRLLARAQATLGGLLLTSNLFTASRSSTTSYRQTNDSSLTLCGR